MSRPQKRAALAIVLTLALVAFLPPLINANRLRSRVAATASRALSRQVTVGDISIQLLPRPAFVITNFSVADDPSFSAEPLLHSDEVTADLRLASLWRGRFEIARLSLKEPSLNLVRNAAGKWNLESLLAHAYTIPAAPTTKKESEVRPRFPYIEADSGRINYKSGLNKEPFALFETDFALWQESETEWRMRVEGRPVRTDQNLGDTGTLSVEASLHRSGELRQSPFDARIRWRDAQLGNLTSLLDGRDRGWRGLAEIDARLTGTTALLHSTISGSIDDFRRYDIASLASVRVPFACSLDVVEISRAQGIDCLSDDAEKHVQLTGSWWPGRGFDLAVSAARVKADFLARLARVSKRNLPDDFSATGEASAEFHFVRGDAGGTTESGRAQLTGIEVSSRLLDTRMQIGDVALKYQPANPEDSPGQKQLKRRSSRGKRTARKSPTPVTSVASSQLSSGAFAIRTNDAPPLAAAAQLDSDGLTISLRGATTLETLLRTASLFGVKDPRLNAEGSADVDLTLRGIWSGFSAPTITGTTALKDVTAQVDGLASPLLIHSGKMNITPSGYDLSNISAHVGVTSITGSVMLPRQCTGPCQANFDLRSELLNLDELNRELNPRLRPAGWFERMKRAFGGAAPRDRLLAIQAQGNLTVSRAVLKDLVLSDVTSHLAYEDGRIILSQITARALGGTFSGDCRISTDEGPATRLQGAVTGISAAEIAALTHDDWGSGTVSGTVDIRLKGDSATSLRGSAEGESDFDWKNGALLSSSQNIPQKLVFKRWWGHLAFEEGKVTIDPSRMQVGPADLRATATADLQRDFTLHLSTEAGTRTIIGRLSGPAELGAHGEERIGPRAQRSASQ